MKTTNFLKIFLRSFFKHQNWRLWFWKLSKNQNQNSLILKILRNWNWRLLLTKSKNHTTFICTMYLCYEQRSSHNLSLMRTLCDHLWGGQTETWVWKSDFFGLRV
jgi:hypothetical protein